MAVSTLLVKTYAQNVFLSGANRLTARDGYPGLKGPEYYVPTEQFAATNYFIDDLDHALNVGWINQQEYDETMALKIETDPQYRPVDAAAAEEPPATV